MVVAYPGTSKDHLLVVPVFQVGRPLTLNLYAGTFQLIINMHVCVKLTTCFVMPTRNQSVYSQPLD